MVAITINCINNTIPNPFFVKVLEFASYNNFQSPPSTRKVNVRAPNDRASHSLFKMSVPLLFTRFCHVTQAPGSVFSVLMLSSVIDLNKKSISKFHSVAM